jgi:hypothetical protein
VKVAIVGSRRFSEPSRVSDYVNSLPPRASIITGSASFDELADASRSAARNQRLVDACDVLVAFWDGSSQGTRATVERALDSGKEVHVFIGRVN